MEEQPSHIQPCPSDPNLFYVNSWIKNKIFLIKVDALAGTLEILEQADTQGRGPTYMSVTNDGQSLLVVTYAGGTLEAISLLPSGCFDSSRKTSVHKFGFDAAQNNQSSLRLDERQEASHPHHIVGIPNTDRYLIPDLGGDRIWYMDCRGAAIECSGSLIIPPGSGPRHGCLSPDGQYFFLVHELSSSLSAHCLIHPSSGVSTGSCGVELSDPLWTVSTLPENLRGHVSSAAPYDYIACSINVIPSADSSNYTVLVSNRNAAPDLIPRGDSVVKFRIRQTVDKHCQKVDAQAGKGVEIVSMEYYHCDLRHVRCLTASVTSRTPCVDTTLVVMAGRNSGGVTVTRLTQGDEGKLETLVANFQNPRIKLPVHAVWLDE